MLTSNAGNRAREGKVMAVDKPTPTVAHTPTAAPISGHTTPSPCPLNAPTPFQSASDICTHASTLVSITRAHTYGDLLQNHRNIVELWNGYLWDFFKDGRRLSPLDAAQMMGLVKKARSKLGAYNPDDYIDDVGYAAIAGEIASRLNSIPPTENSMSRTELIETIKEKIIKDIVQTERTLQKGAGEDLLEKIICFHLDRNLPGESGNSKEPGNVA